MPIWAIILLSIALPFAQKAAMTAPAPVKQEPEAVQIKQLTAPKNLSVTVKKVEPKNE